MIKERELLEWVLIFLQPHASEEALNLHKEITELLAQPEQAPVAWRYKTHNRYTYTEENYHELEGEGEPLYASPPKREHLSDNEIFNAWSPSKKSPCVHSFKAGVKFAEKAHKIGVR